MKQMTCSHMGNGMSGLCDTIISGNTAKEMSDNGWKHLQAAHPDMAKGMQDQTQEQRDSWFSEFEKKFDAAPKM